MDLKDSEGCELRPLLTQPKRLALLAYLALAGSSGFRRRDTVVALFWPELDEEHARGSLRQALRFLRRSLGEGVIVSRGEEEIGVDRGALRCDATAFVEACEGGRHAEALDLYQGAFLDGLFVSEAAPELERWVEEERIDLRRRAAASAWSLADGYRVAGDRSGAATLARRAGGFAPEDEGELARLIAFLDDLGDRAGALAAYDEFARRLKQEYSALPAPETQALIRSVRERTAIGFPTRAVSPSVAAAETVAGPAPRARRTLVYLAVGGVVALVGYLAAFANRRPPFDPERATVVVLPLEDLSGDSTQSYLASGVTEQLITDLAQGGALRVINRRTMMAYSDPAKTVQDIARTLHADAIVSGTVQRLGDTVYMTAQLVLANQDGTIWAQSYEGTRGDLLRMQREVARAVTRRLRGALTPTQQAGLASARPLDPEALDLYIQGRYWWNKRGPGLLKSIQLFKQALDLDATFALAYSGMADAYVQLGYGGLLSPSDAFRKAEAAALHALQLDSTLAEPHATLGFVRMYYYWDWASADREFQHALALNPSYATGHEWYGLFLTAMGRYDEAMAHERRAQDLDPLSPSIDCTTGWVLHYSGRQDDAERELQVALRMDSTFTLGHLYLGRVYQAKGQMDSALSQYATTGPLRNWVPTVAAEGYVYGVLGRRREAQAALVRMDSLSRRQYVTAYAVALVHTALGQRDSAFAWLARGVRERTHWLGGSTAISVGLRCARTHGSRPWSTKSGCRREAARMRVATTDRVTQSTKSLSTDAPRQEFFGFPVFPGFEGRVGVTSTVTMPCLRDSFSYDMLLRAQRTHPRPRPSSATDRVLVQRITRGDETAFSELLARYRSTVYATAYAVLLDPEQVDAVVADAFEEARRSAADFLVTEGSVSGWLTHLTRLRIARHHAT